MKHLIMNISEVTPAIRNKLKNYNQRNGFFIEDRIATIPKYRGRDGNTYVVLSFEQRPSEVPAKFREDAQDEKLRVVNSEQLRELILRFAVLNDF